MQTPRPNARTGKRQRRKDERPAEILQAAFDTFIERGFTRTRLEDVGRRAGVSKATIYVYFDNKETLLRDVLFSRADNAFEDVIQLHANWTGTSRDLLEQTVRTFYTLMIGTPLGRLWRVLIAEGDRVPDVMQAYHERIVQPLQTRMRAMIAAGIARGEFQPSRAEHMPIVLMAPGLLPAIWFFTFQARHPLDIDAYLETHLDVIFNGLLASGANEAAHQPP